VNHAFAWQQQNKTKTSLQSKQLRRVFPLLSQSILYILEVIQRFSFKRRLGPRIAGPAGPSRLNVKLLLLLPAGLGSLRVPVW
jgi:hypothetical protein